MNNDELQIAEALLKQESKRIYCEIVGGIRKCYRFRKDGSYKTETSSLIGTLILWCCAIDYYGGLLEGFKKYRNRQGKLKKEDYSSKQRIKAFVKDYLKRYGNYDYNKVYKLRNSLVHSYTLDGYGVVECDSNKRKTHLTKDEKDRHLLHLELAVKDLKKAIKDYMKDVTNDDKLKICAYEYYTIHPFSKTV